MSKQTWSTRLIHSLLLLQDRVMTDVQAGLKDTEIERKARLVIEGDGGGQFFLRWDGKELREEFNDDGVRNTISMHSQTLYDMATGELGVREAVSACLITVSGDKSVYDEEDIAKLLENLQGKIVDHINRRREREGAIDTTPE